MSTKVNLKDFEELEKKDPTQVMTPVQPTEQTIQEPVETSEQPKSNIADLAGTFLRNKELVKEAPEVKPIEAPEKPNQSNYQYNTSFMDKYLETPLTQEEQDRRSRAAYTAKGVSDLGNAIGALGNLFYVAGGAAPQQLPQSPDVDTKVNAMKERADRVRSAYINGHLQGRNADLNEYNNAYNRWMQAQNYNQEAAQKNYQNQVARTNQAISLANAQNAMEDQQWRRENTEKQQEIQRQQWERQFAESQRQFNANYSLQKEKQRFNQEYHRASLALQGLKVSSGGTGNGKNSLPATGVMQLSRGVNGRADVFGTVDNAKLKQGYFLRGLMAKLPDGAIKKEMAGILKDQNVTKEPVKLYNRLSELVSIAAVNNEDVRNYLVNSGVVVPNEQLNSSNTGMGYDTINAPFANGPYADKGTSGIDYTKPVWNQ